jgi:PAS domain-containing protein
MSPRRPKKASQLATALIEHSSDAIVLVDEAGTVLYANPALLRMFGVDRVSSLRPWERFFTGQNLDLNGLGHEGNPGQQSEIIVREA